MTLDDAIERLTALSKGKFAGSLAEEEEAQRLGMEALKRRREWTRGQGFNPDFMLPGETKD